MFLDLFRNFQERRGEKRNVNILPTEHIPEVDAVKMFWDRVGSTNPKSVLEVGTLQSIPGRSTHSKHQFPEVADANYVRLDIAKDCDVDFVGDIHSLPSEWNSRFDCFIAEAVFEHLERPWIAAKEVSRVLAPGGTFHIATHQCFPIHGYPSDFFRFSKEALRLILEDAGLHVEVSQYEHRCLIVPPENIVPDAGVGDWNKRFPAYILVRAVGYKPT